MEGKGQPQPAALPRHPTPQLPGARRGRQSAAAATTVLQPPSISQASQQHTPTPATILHQMFSTCVARGIAAKLVYKTVGGKVETSLYCSTAAATAAAAASGSQKKRRKRPDNERRKMKREAWLQRRTVSRPDNVSAATAAAATAAANAAATAAATAAKAAAATAAIALEEVVLSSGVRAAAVVDTLTQDPGQGGEPAAPGTASTVPESAAATSPRAWA